MSGRDGFGMGRGGFWAGPVGRWIGSTKNIVGSAVGVLVIAAHAVIGLGPFWPLVLVAGYAAGALLAPRERLQVRLELGEGASAEDLIAQLRQIRRAQRRLDAETRPVLERLLGVLDDVLGRWDEVVGSAEHAQTVEAIVGDYLPTSLQRYLDLPAAMRSGRAGGGAPRAELLDQLDLLERESLRIRDAVHAHALRALDDQGRFLRDRFGRSSLEL